MKDYYGEELKIGDEVFPLADCDGLNCNVPYKIVGFPGEVSDGGYIELRNDRGERYAYGSRAFMLNPASRMFKNAEAVALESGSLGRSESSDPADS